MINDTENRNRPLALLITIVFHGLLLLLFILVIFRTPIPPYPTVGGGGGLEVNFGSSQAGFGDVQTEQYIPIDIKINQTTPTPKIKTSTSKDDEIITQDIEDAPEVYSKENKKKTEQVKEEIKINDPVVNPKALYKKSSKPSNEGIAGGAGDQGSPTGSLYSKNYTGDGGSGGGTGGGHGTGSGTGIGSGSGPGTGTLKGINFSLEGRKVKYLPKPPRVNLQHQEIVVVSIWVDNSGNVTRVVTGEKGTTATDHRLFKMAEEYALKSKFDANPKAKEIQKGSITYIFTPGGQ